MGWRDVRGPAFLVVGLMLLLIAFVLPAHAQEGTLLYVPNNATGNVSVFQTNADGTLTSVGTVTVGTGAFGAVVRGDQAFAYITNATANTLSVIDTKTQTVVQTIATGLTPRGLAFNPDGSRLYVANNSGTQGVSVFTVNATTGQLILERTLTTGLSSARNVKVSPDGSRLYVVSQGNDTLVVFDTVTNTRVTSITVGDQPIDVALNASGTRAYVTNLTSGTVSVVNTATNTVIATVATGGTGPTQVVVSPDGTRVYVANTTSGTITRIDATTNTTIATPVSIGGATNFGIAVTPDGRFLYATTQQNDLIGMFAIGGNGALNSLGSQGIGLGDSNPSGIGMCGNGSSANGMLGSGGIFIANQSSALACAGSSGPTFTGGTLFVNNSGLNFTTNISLGAGGGTISTNGNDATISGAISGTGNFTKSGTGVLTLSGANTYSGATAVTAGTLRAGATNALSSASAVTVGSGATLDLNSFNQSIASLAGGGSVTLGSATLTTGGNDTSTTFSGVISGTGGLTKIGTGTFTLSGSNTYTGTTLVSAGRLVNNGVILGAVVADGGMVSGSGTFGGSLSFGAGTTIAPGNSIGTIRVTGNLTFASGATYEVEVNAAGQADLIQVTGIATLNGAPVRVLPEDGTYARRTRYTILTATGGIAGTFGTVTSSLALLTPTLTYDANNVFLTLTRNDVTYRSLGRTRNQRSVGGALDAIAGAATDDFSTLVDAVNVLTADQVPAALQKLSGEAHATGRTIALLAADKYVGTMRERFATLRNGVAAPSMAFASLTGTTMSDADGMELAPLTLNHGEWWSLAYGAGGDIANDGQARGARYVVAGTAAGADVVAGEGLRVGVSGGYAHTFAGIHSLGDRVDIDSYQVATYGRWDLGVVELEGIVGYMFDDYTASRSVTVGFLERRATAQTSMHALATALEAGRTIPAGRFYVRPAIGLAHAHLWTNEFTERRGGPINLRVDDDTFDSLGASLEVRVGTRIALGEQRALVPEARVRYTRELLEDGPTIRSAFVAAPNRPFGVEGVTMSDRVELGVRVLGQVSRNVSVNLDAGGDLGASRTGYSLAAQINVTW